MNVAAAPATMRRPRHLRRCAGAMLLAWGIGAAGAEPAAGSIQALLPPPTSAAALQLARFYAEGDYAPAWTDGGDVRAALLVLDGAAEEGLETADYGATALRRLLELRDAGAPPDARLDIALSAAMLRYLTHLHGGRAPSALLAYGVPVADPFDAGALLRTALRARRVAGLPALAAPTFTLYGRLRVALRRYRELAAQGDVVVSAGVQPVPTGGVPPDQIAGLRDRLAQLGDLPAVAATLDGRDGTAELAELAAALRRFQQRHGLQVDGIAGRATLAALSVPLRERVRQIAFAMERLRWLPPLPDRRVVAINLPSYRLWALEPDRAGARPVLDMRVIIGRATVTPTPVFVAYMRYVEFNPYWNVPASIVRTELLPRLRHDAAYAGRNQFEFVQAGTVSRKVDAATLAGLRDGTVRVRQRPGPANALGAVKFGVPNPMSIYLHGTPARELFDPARRDFSHGCIRVEAPAALAAFVLDDVVAWNGEAVAQAMRPGPSRAVPLAAPLPVVIFYTTAIARADGTLEFLEDVYGLDAALARRWERQGDTAATPVATVTRP